LADIAEVLTLWVPAL